MGIDDFQMMALRLCLLQDQINLGLVLEETKPHPIQNYLSMSLILKKRKMYIIPKKIYIHRDHHNSIQVKRSNSKISIIKKFIVRHKMFRICIQNLESQYILWIVGNMAYTILGKT